MPTRDDVVSLAASVEGLHAPDDAYVEWLMPARIETAENRAAARLAAPVRLGNDRLLEPWSCCLLTIRSLWRELGCEHPLLARPYRTGMAMVDVETIARAFGAWHSPTDAAVPGLGDVVIVGVNPRLHGYVIKSLDALHGDGMRLESTDGGQGPHGCAIRGCKRLWPSWSDRWRDVVELATGPLERPVYGWAETLPIIGG